MNMLVVGPFDFIFNCRMEDLKAVAVVLTMTILNFECVAILFVHEEVENLSLLTYESLFNSRSSVVFEVNLHQMRDSGAQPVE